MNRGVVGVSVSATVSINPIGVNSTTGTRNAILAEPATTAVHDNVGIDVPILL